MNHDLCLVREVVVSDLSEVKQLIQQGNVDFFIHSSLVAMHIAKMENFNVVLLFLKTKKNVYYVAIGFCCLLLVLYVILVSDVV